MNLRLRTLVSLLLLIFLLSLAVSPAFAQTAPDWDKDGIPDSMDRCPGQAGPRTNNGCPVSKPQDQPNDQGQPPTNDKDGDGTLDDADRCPLDGGPSWNAGCPTPATGPTTDKDGDGVADGSDGCPDQPGTAANGGCLPTLPDTGPCVLATKGTDGVNIRVLPAVQRAIIAVLGPDDTRPVLARLLTGDGEWFFTGDGWAAARVVRLGGECDPAGEPVVLCSLLTDLMLNSPDVLHRVGFDGNCRNTDDGLLIPAVIPTCDGSVKPEDLIPTDQSQSGGGGGAGKPGDPPGGVPAADPPGGASEPEALVPAVQDGDSSAAFGDGSVKPGEPNLMLACDGSDLPDCNAVFAVDAFMPTDQFGSGGGGGAGKPEDNQAGGGGGAGKPENNQTGGGGGAGKPGELLPACDGSVIPGELVPAVKPGSEKTCDGSVMPADFNGDGVADVVTAGGVGEAPLVTITDGTTQAVLLNFAAYDLNFKGGVNIAVGDVNGDGVADLITGAGPGGGPHVKVFDGKTFAPLASFFAFNPAFTGGVRVAVGDVNGDCAADIITEAMSLNFTHTRAFDGKSLQVLSDVMA